MKSPWAAAKAPFVHVASVLAVRAAAACTPASKGRRLWGGEGGNDDELCGQASDVALTSSAAALKLRSSRYRRRGGRGGVGEAGCSDDELCEQPKDGVALKMRHIGDRGRGGGEGSLCESSDAGYRSDVEGCDSASGDSASGDSDSEVDVLDLVRWLWGKHNKRKGRRGAAVGDQDVAEGEEEDADEEEDDSLRMDAGEDEDGEDRGACVCVLWCRS